MEEQAGGVVNIMRKEENAGENDCHRAGEKAGRH